MKKSLFIAISLFMFTEMQTNANTIWHPTFPKTNSCYQKDKQLPNVTASYNSSTTQLSVAFGAGQGGKVEIYRNGAKVVNATAAAGASLSYVLRNYGNGNYTVIVSQGNTVVYSENVRVK